MLRGSGSVLIILNVRARTGGGRNEFGLGSCTQNWYPWYAYLAISRGFKRLAYRRRCTRLHIGPVITDARSWALHPRSPLPCSACTPLLRLGLVRACHTATCAHQTQRGSYMAKVSLILHATRGRADAFCTRTAWKRAHRVWVSFPFFLCIIEPRDQRARSFTLTHSCMTGGHECATELALVRVVGFIAVFLASIKNSWTLLSLL